MKQQQEAQQNILTHEKHGLRTTISPTNMNELQGFQDEQISVISDIKFMRARTKFHNGIRSNVQTNNASKEIIVAADETNKLHIFFYVCRPATIVFRSQLINPIKRRNKRKCVSVYLIRIYIFI